MSIVVRFNPASVTAQKYDEVLKTVQDELGLGDGLAEGCELHVCFGPEDNVRVSEIWDSRAQFEAFGEKLMPILARAGIDAGQPDVFDVHNIIKR